jgi:Arc/MetJ-type ribon-helix-helix transcriptional regulator
MSIHLPDDLAGCTRAAVLRGQFASADEMVAAAVRDCLRRKHAQARPAGDATAAGLPALAGEERAPRSCSAACARQDCSAKSSRRSPTSRLTTITGPSPSG